MSDWSNFGLPPLQSPGYGYSIDPGLLRTGWDVPQPRQKRLNMINPHTFSAYAYLYRAELASAETALQVFGCKWFTIDLISGEHNSAGGSTSHLVRLVDNYQVSAVGHNIYKLELQMEMEPTPWKWLIDDTEVWLAFSNQPFIAGVRMHSTPNATEIGAVRFRAGQRNSILSAAAIWVNGLRTDIITTQTDLHDAWKTVTIDTIPVAQGSVIDVAMQSPSPYAVIWGKWAENPLISGWGTNGSNIGSWPPVTFVDAAYGIDFSFK